MASRQRIRVMSEKSGCVPLHWQRCRASVSMGVLPARERARPGHIFKTVGRHDFSDVSSLVGSRARGGDPSCSGALSADGRWVRIHTTAPAVGSASKLSTPGALRRTSEVGRSHSLSAYGDSPTIGIGTIFSSPRGASCNLTKRQQRWPSHCDVETRPRFRRASGGVN